MEKDRFKNIERFGNTLKTYKNACFYCGASLNDYNRDVDHLVPKSKGGIKSNDNKVYSCCKCNRLKSDMTPEEFYSFIESSIRLEKSFSREKVGYLIKIRNKVDKMIRNKKTKNNVSVSQEEETKKES